ncbi:PGPGW domain-containing protein [Arsenicicoccus dermatophilus]|uniref:PGPGW domain-containing protein n=1 Tax=Arsenicicoccus dermatophilus TaxID=1076331 RepID=UPI001F4CB446|nr:PGPGW domain-containing protein [Arsenicicoccus dermatophilus]
MPPASGLRARLRSHPLARTVWRAGVALAGLVVVVVGLVLVPLAGPGWLIVLGGVGIWALEFDRARRVHRQGRELLVRWTRWVAARAWWVRAALGASTAALVAAVSIAMLWLTGVPAWLPDAVEQALVGGLRRWLPAR